MKKIKDKEFPLMKKQQESLKNMVYQAILNGIFTDEVKIEVRRQSPAAFSDPHL